MGTPELDALLKGKAGLENLVSSFGDIDKITKLTNDLLPSDMFPAEIDGIKVEVSIGISQGAIVINFIDRSQCPAVFAEMKKNTTGFFKRFFNTK